MTVELLAFDINSQRYALAVSDVIEVVRAVAVTRLPLAPAVVMGIINVRGRVVPVLDLRARFRHPARALDPSQQFIIARAGERVVALPTDHAVGLTRVSAADVEPLSASVPHARYVAGVAKTPDGVVLIHDLLEFLSAAESESLDEALDSLKPITR